MRTYLATAIAAALCSAVLLPCASAAIPGTARIADTPDAGHGHAAPPATTRFIVHFDGASHARAAMRRAASPTGTTRSLQTSRADEPSHVRSLASGGEVFEATPDQQAVLEALPGVLAVEEDRLLTRTSVGEPLWRRQWYMHDPRVGTDARVAWRYTQGEGATVAVIDTGITPHPEFDGQLLPGYDFISDADAARDGDGRDADPTDEGDWIDVGDCRSSRAEASSWHGSHVTGLIAARGGNGLGMVGIAPASKVVPVRVLGRCGARVSDLADAVTWASGGIVAGVPRIERGVDVINLSLGGPGACGMAMQQAITQARARGTAVIVAAGNDGIKASNFTPANCAGVVTVGALARNGAMAWYSNHGAGITLSAPGGSLDGHVADDIVSAVDSGLRGRQRAMFAYYGGTSMAAPQVTGLVALMRSVDPAISVDMIAQQLVDNARPLPGPCPKGCGAGLMDAGATVDAVVEDRALRAR